VTHPNLMECNLKEVRRQMMGSRQRLEEKLGVPIQLFAYPYGGRRSFNKKIQACAKKSGFLAACTTIPGKNGLRTNLYALHRLPSLHDELRSFASQLNRAVAAKSPQNNIRGISKEAMQLWMTRHKKTRQFV
jgi:peptidoglycan/xylan/chitin deacetylase (PgdA/CDA1 family)